MDVTVRCFGGLRDAAFATATVDAPDLPTLLRVLRERHGEPFSTRLERSTVVVDGEPTDPEDPTPLREGAEVVLLPPFAGG